MKNIALLAGGNSGEREVSIKSAQHILEHIDTQKYTPFFLVLTEKKIVYTDLESQKDYPLDLNTFSLCIEKQTIVFDFVFNMIHGTPGEDGLISGYIEFLGIPHSTCLSNILALTFDKEMCKKALFDFSGLNFAKSLCIKNKAQLPDKDTFPLSFPVFVKPSQGGSSVGMSKVYTYKALSEAYDKAYKEFPSVLIEEFIEGTEVTCGVFKNNKNIQALGVTEIEHSSDFFDYAAKYESKSTNEITPARISQEALIRCKRLSVDIYKALSCKGCIRIDYILNDKAFYFIELNTIPGMSKESIVPKQIKAAGLSISQFIHLIIENAS